MTGKTTTETTGGRPGSTVADSYAGTLGQPRYVWSPEAHSWFGEQCFFFLIALPSVSNASRSEVESLVEKCNIQSKSVYLAYGTYDLVLRMWATHEEVRRLSTSLNEQYGYPEMEIFEVSDIDYSRWSSPAELPTNESIVKHYDLIKSAVDDPNADPPSQLSDAGIVHFHGGERWNPADHVRVYILLRRGAGDVHHMTRERKRALEKAIGELSELEMPSVYYGVSRSIDCIIKGFIPSIEIAIFHKTVLALHERLSYAQIDLRPMTLIMAQDGEIDRDYLRIDLHESQDSVSMRRLKGFLRPGAVSELDAVDREFANDLAEAFASNWEIVSESSFARPFLDLLEGLITQDEYKVNGSLSFLIALEGHFTKRALTSLRRIAAGIDPERADTEDGDWRIVLSDALKNASNSADKAEEASALAELATKIHEPRKLGFGEVVNLLRQLTTRNLVPAEVVTAALGGGWEQVFDVVDVRNDFAHARLLFPDPPVGTESPSRAWWGLHGKDVLHAGRFLARFEEQDGAST